MTKDKVETAVHAMLADASTQDVVDYINRGRRFEKVSAEEIKKGWISAMKLWADQPRSVDRSVRQQIDDFQAELALRREEPPWEDVKGELDTICKAAVASADELTTEQLESLGAEIIGRISKPDRSN